LIYKNNIDSKTVDGFGDEWIRFDQSELSEKELVNRFNEYFNVFPWESLPKNPIGFDAGCGSGRWAKIVSRRVKTLHCIEPSSAINVAIKNLETTKNCIFHHVDIDNIPFKDNSMDFGYSLGVLHHMPDTLDGLKKCVIKLKIGAPFLVYLYYSFDNKPYWFQLIWKFSNYLRIFISKRSYNIRFFLSQLIAIFVYLPLANLAKIFEKLGFKVNNFPLSYYRKYSFYSMRTDALDRFGTRLEVRFSKSEIKKMLVESGLTNIKFSNSSPYWCASGIKE